MIHFVSNDPVHGREATAVWAESKRELVIEMASRAMDVTAMVPEIFTTEYLDIHDALAHDVDADEEVLCERMEELEFQGEHIKPEDELTPAAIEKLFCDWQDEPSASYWTWPTPPDEISLCIDDNEAADMLFNKGQVFWPLARDYYGGNGRYAEQIKGRYAQGKAWDTACQHGLEERFEREFPDE